MADAGASSTNFVSTTFPNADQMGVDGRLETLASYIVQGQAAWTTHDGATLNSLLQQFWSESGSISAADLNDQSTGSLIGGTVMQDLVALDAYSHRMLGFEYMYQICYANPTDIPGILAKEQEQFTAAVSEFTQVGLTRQAAHDANVLKQAAGWASQTAAHWIDDSYLASVKTVIQNDIQAAGNLIDNVGSALDFLTSTPVLIVGALLAAYLLLSGKS